MRKEIFLTGIILIAVGGILMALSTVPRTIEATTREDIADKSFPSPSHGEYDYETKIYLVSGTYRLDYDFSSAQTITFYVRVLDPDGILMKQADGTERYGFLTFETQKTGEHTFQIGGQFQHAYMYLDRLKQETKTIYPYEAGLYLGLLFVIGGAVASIAGALKK
jgi:hypothetical protein